MKKAFTLVELLIVIALIAILSVAVLATINPIEQANKARDAAQKNDAAEVLSAYERYYTGQNSYPWGSPEDVGATTIVSTDPMFGVAASATSEGILITTSELKSSFAAKTPFGADATAVDLMFVYNDGSDSNYVCYVPKAKANRSQLGMLRCLSYANGLSEPGDTTTGCANAPDNSWTRTSYLSDTAAYFMCVPETAAVSAVTGAPTVDPLVTP